MKRTTKYNPSGRPLVTPSLALVACVMALVTGCNSEPGTAPDAKSAAVVKTSEAPGVTLRLSADTGNLGISERMTVEIEIEALDGITIAADSYENALRESEHRFDFRMIGSTREESVPTGQGSLRWRYAYDLEFVLPETYELPSAVVTYTDTRQGEGKTPAAGESKSLETETLTIVVSDAANAPPSEEEMATIATPPPAELRSNVPWGWVIPVVVVIVIICVILLRRIRRERPEVKFVIPAHEWAQRELSALAAEHLIDQGLIQQFHYRISDIVRGYVERRFEVAAPEMTTEEFLATAAGDGRFGADVTGELQRFLEACDFVKYAGVDPGPDEPTQLMQTADGFVDRTKADATESPGTGEVARAEENAA